MSAKRIVGADGAVYGSRAAQALSWVLTTKWLPFSWLADCSWRVTRIKLAQVMHPMMGEHDGPITCSRVLRRTPETPCDGRNRISRGAM